MPVAELQRLVAERLQPVAADADVVPQRLVVGRQLVAVAVVGLEPEPVLEPDVVKKQ